MKRRKKTSFTIKRLIFLTSLFIGVGMCLWYFFIRPHSEASIGLQPLPEGFHSHGIDVSHHQGEIDWEKFMEKMDSKIGFVYCKVTEGTSFIDPMWKQHNEFFTNQEMKHGGYHFFLPDVSAPLQAEHFLKHYLPTNCGMPPVLDAEIEASTDDALINGMREWLKIVETKTNVRPVIYTSYSMYRDKMKGKFPHHQFWIASYNRNEERLKDPAIIHWQYSDRGKLPGINELVDLNFSKESYGPLIEQAR